MDNFIKTKILEDSQTEKWDAPPSFRFPPEPNGYLHLGHAKAICLNYALAEGFGGTCHLRFDDTNPTNEDPKYYDAIKQDLAWLGFLTKESDQTTTCFTSNYFEKLYDWATTLITNGDAYVCECTAEEMANLRGKPALKGAYLPGKPCPHRDRSPGENAKLFTAMRAGKYPNGVITLRAKIDLSSLNLNLRDPVMYRVNHAKHPRLEKDPKNQCECGCNWCLYPAYDWAHGQSDALEKITYSICTLEFELHRSLYDWFLTKLELDFPKPEQIEFARLNLTHTLMSKRKLKEMVDDGLVSGWDDPRMPTLSGLRRRGFTPRAIKNFCESIGVSKVPAVIPLSRLEASIRDDLNEHAERRMVITKPIKLIIENYPEDQIEWLSAINNPEDESKGTRLVPFSRELWIEEEDFLEDAPRKILKNYYRLKPGNEVRLRYAYYITCTGCERDPKTGELLSVRAIYDPKTRGGSDPGGRRVRGTIHWVSIKRAVPATLRLINPLFMEESPDGAEDYDPNSMEILSDAMVEPFLVEECLKLLNDKDALPPYPFQFERKGYYVLDPVESHASKEENPKLVFNQTVSLRDSWAKIAKK